MRRNVSRALFLVLQKPSPLHIVVSLLFTFWWQVGRVEVVVAIPVDSVVSSWQ